MVSEDMSVFNVMLKHLTDTQKLSDMQRLQSKIQQGSYAKEDAMIDFPHLPWIKILSFISNAQHKTVQPVVLPADPPSKRPRPDSEEDDSRSDSYEDEESQAVPNPSRLPRQKPNSVLNHENVNIRWVKIARPRGGEKLSPSSMETLSQGVQEYMKFMLDSVSKATQYRSASQLSNFDTTLTISSPSEILKEVEEKEKEERKEQLRLEQQAKQRKRVREGDMNQGISDAMNTSKRQVSAPDIDMPSLPVREVVTLKDVLTVLEGDAQWRKSAFLQRLYSCSITERSPFSG